MNIGYSHVSSRSIAIAAALVGTVSLAIEAHAALNKRALDTAKTVATVQSADAAGRPSRPALVIGNSHYPYANVSLTLDDARSLSDALRLVANHRNASAPK